MAQTMTPAVAQAIPFAQYLRPDGRTRPMTIERPTHILALATAVIAAGGRFEIEELTTGDVSMTVEHPDFERWDESVAVAICLCPNGPAVPETVDALVRDAYAVLVGALSSELEPNSYERAPHGLTLEWHAGEKPYYVRHERAPGSFRQENFATIEDALDRFAEILTQWRCVECGWIESSHYMEEYETAIQAQRVCFSCLFWRSRIADADAMTAIINGQRYQIEADRPGVSSGSLGFGGSRFVIRFHDGRWIETRNLWTQGKIPAHFRERMPDNAVFTKERAQ